jgi:predicted dehydrogenase
MKYALVGVSHPHLPAWIAAARALGVELPVVHDPDPRLAAATAADLNAEVISPSDLAGTGVDGALVIARNDQQYDLATQCVEHSLPTLLEKTGAQTAPQFRKLIELADRAKVPVQIAYYLRYSDSVRFTKNLLTHDGLGRVSLARFHVGMPQVAWDQHGNWFRNKELVSSLFTEEACHVLDIVFELFGEPSAVTARAKTALHGGQIGGVGEDSLAAILDYDPYLVYLDFVSLEANPWLESWDIQVYGTEASLRGGLLPAWVQVVRRDGWWEDVGFPVSTSVPEFEGALANNVSTCLQRALGEFIKVSRREQAPPIDVVRGSHVASCIEVIHEAVRTGKTVPISTANAKEATAR